MQHVDIAVSIENPKYTKLGKIEKDVDTILNVSLKEGTCERYLSALKFYKFTVRRCQPFSRRLRLEREWWYPWL